MKRFVLLLTVVALMIYSENLWGNQVQENDPIIEMEPVIVSASRIATEIENTSNTFTVITRDEIDKIKPASVVDILRNVPGLRIDQLGGRGGLSSIYMRGSDANYTLILIDGVKVNDPSNTRGGSFDFSTLNIASIERVEVIRGPMSAIHGSDAMAGVINIVTHPASLKPEYSMEVGAGSDGYYNGNILLKGPVSDMADYALHAGYLDNGNPVPGDEFKSGDVIAKVNVYPSDATEIMGSIRYSDNHKESFPEDSGGPQFAVLREVDKRDSKEISVGVDFSHKFFTELELKLNSNWYNRNEDTTSPGVAPGVRDPFGIPANSSDNDFSRTHVGASVILSHFKGFRSALGLDAEFENGNNDFILFVPGSPMESQFDMHRQTYSPFLEMQYTFGFGLTLLGGLRIDIPEDFDTEYSPKLGAIYKIEASNTTLKANWGKGFKLPSFFSLSNPVVGNPDLQPETSNGVDLSVVQEFFDKRLRINATPFYTRFYNVIDLDEGPPPKLVNRSEVDTSGVEMGLKAMLLQNLQCYVHATYVHTNIKNTDEELRNRPDWVGGITVRWTPKNDLILNLAVNYVDETLDSSIATGDLMLDDYTRVDFAVAYKPKPYLEVAIAIDNLFDEEYQEAIGFPAPGIRPRFSLKAKF